ncbi:MAG: phage tail tube protein [archaeon]
MSKFIGRQQYFGLAKEDTRGTAESTADYWYPFTDFSVQQRDEKTTDAPAYGRIEQSGNIEQVRKYSQGDITALVGVNGMPLILENLLGSLSSSDNGDQTYTHTITVKNDPVHQSLTMIRKDDVNQYAFPLGMLESFSLDIDIEADEKVYAEMSFTGKSSVSNDDTPSFDTDEVNFTPNMLTITTADSGGGLDDGDDIPAKTFSIDISPESLERDHDFESGKEPSDINNLGLGVSGSFTANFSDNTYEDLVFNNTTKAIRMELKDTDTTIGSESENPSMRIDIEKAYFEEIEKSGGNDELVTQEISFQGRYDLGAAKMIEATITNTESSY